jgi:polysaccharide export outer membrane protein
VRVVGQAVKPQSLPWRPGMTVLDAVIQAGGLTEFADGNRAVLVRRENGETVRYRLRLQDLLQEGDIAANAELLPGDTVIVPETLF